MRKGAKSATKPGSVAGGEPPGAVIPLGLTSPSGSSSQPGSGASHAIASLFGLAPDGVYRAGPVTRPAVGSYPTVSPLPDPERIRAIGGLFSVALSVASRRPAVSRHPALWSPDFPPPSSDGGDCLGELRESIIRAQRAGTKATCPSFSWKVPTRGPNPSGLGRSQRCTLQSSVDARYHRPFCSSAHRRSPAA